MLGFFDAIFTAVTLLVALALLLGLLSFIYWRHAIDWQAIEQAYHRPWQEPMQMKRLQTLLLYSDGRMTKSYKGLLTLGLYRDGIGMRMNPVLVPFHRPVFIPFTDISGWTQKWFIDAKSVELSFAKVPHLRIIMPADQMDWVAGSSGGAVSISPEQPPHGKWPYASFAIAVIFGAWAVLLIVYLLFRFVD
jgi:hypothetical protein